MTIIARGWIKIVGPPMVWYCQRVSLHFCQLLKHVLNIFSVIYIGSSLKLGTGANSDPGKFAHGFISPLSKILRFAPFPQVPTHVQQQDSLVFTGRRSFFFYHWNSAFQSLFFSNNVIRGRFHAKFHFFSYSVAFVGHLGQVFNQRFSVAEPKSKSPNILFEPRVVFAF